MGFQGNEYMRTPNIDALARSGRILQRHYSYTYCSPTRVSFLSGRLPMNVQGGENMPTLDLRMKPIGQKLQEAGYATHMYGKWHAGHQTLDHLPSNQGFDSFLGYLATGIHHYETGYTCGDWI